MIRVLRGSVHRFARKPLRGVMTLLSFSLSTASLALLVCLVLQIRQYVDSKVLGPGTRVWMSTETHPGFHLTTGHLELLKERGILDLASPYVVNGWESARVDQTRYATSIDVISAGPDYAGICELRMVAGSFFTELEVSDSADVVVVSERFARTVWGEAGAAVGRTLAPELHEDWKSRIFASQYRVIGVFQDPAELESVVNRAADVVVPYRNVTVPGQVGMQTPSAVGWTSRKGFRGIERRIEAALGINDNRGQLAIWQGSPGDLRTTVASSTRGRMQVAAALFAALGMMALLVLGFAALATTTIDVTDDVHAIGLRRALGLSRRGVVAELVAQGSSLVLTGGVIGSALAWLLSTPVLDAVRPLLAAGTDATAVVFPPATTLEAIVVSFAALLIAGIGGSIYPVIQAVRGQPAESQREL